MKKTLMASVLTLALAASAFAAPRAGDLTSGVANGDWLGFGIRDISALPDRPADTLLARAMKLAGDAGEMLRKAGALDARATIKDGDYEKIDRFVMAAELKDASLAQLTQMAPGAEAPDFTVAAPEGTKITPLASVTAEEKIGKVNVALLERDGAVYLIAANGAPEVLADMAKAPENSPLVVAKTPANIWIQVNATRETVEKSDAGLPSDFFVEVGIDDTASTVKVIFWSNLVDVLDAALKEGEEDTPLKGKNLRDVFNGGPAVKAPLLFGTAPLYALLNLSASFLPEGFKLSDIAPAEDAAEAEKTVMDQIGALGFTWDDVVKMLRGNTTIGFAGKLTAPMVGEVPGLFVNVTGIDAAKAKGLLDLAAAQLGGMLGTPAGYNANGWAGYQFSGMVSLLLATGPDGLLAAAMNADQFGTVADVPAGMATAVEPRNVALALNLKELQPVLKNIFAQFGDQLLELGGESVKSQKATIQMVIDNMASYVETVSIVTVDENTFVIEVTPAPALVNQALPPAPAAEAPAPAEVKPAA